MLTPLVEEVVQMYDAKQPPYQTNLRRHNGRKIGRQQIIWKDDIKQWADLEFNELNMKVKDRVE